MQTVVRRDATDVALLQILPLFAGGSLSAWIYREVLNGDVNGRVRQK